MSSHKSFLNERSLQQRIPYETLSGLATTIAEGPIFEIVDGLKEVQQATEKKCFRERLELLKRQAGSYLFHWGHIYICSLTFRLAAINFQMKRLTFKRLVSQKSL